MRKFHFLFLFLFSLGFSLGCLAQLTLPPNGGNKKATVAERVGLTDITIHYDRPGVKGREGKIWGQLVHVGFKDLGFGTSKAAPWRAGANENTTIEFSGNVKINGHPLPAGKYGFFIAYGPEESTLIFSHNNSSWGSFFYDEKEDALRVKVKPKDLDKNVEWLTYEFLDETNNSATVALAWEKKMFPFEVQVDYIHDQLASFRRELRNSPGFNWQSWVQAAAFCARNKTDLEEGLQWADAAINANFVGQKNFLTLSTKAQILNLLDRHAQADTLMKDALSMGTEAQLHQYARQLLAQKKNQEAFGIFQMNYTKHPNSFTTNVGMARGYSAVGNYKKALEYAQKALPQAPDALNKSSVENMLVKLKAEKDIN